MRTMYFGRALREGLAEELRRDKSVFVMGEDIRCGLYTGVSGLSGEFGDRIMDTPLSETAFFGAAIGAAMSAGVRPVVSSLLSFMYVALQQVINDASKHRYMSGGQVKLPLVFMTDYGQRGGALGGGAHHANSTYAMFMHEPGLKVVVASTPYDAKGLLKAAIRDDNPVVFLSGPGGNMEGPVPEEEYIIPLGVADVKRKGTDVTLVAIGPMVQEALSVAEKVSRQGISVEVVDPRTLVPLDKDTILASVKKTGRLVIADEAPRTCGAAAEIATVVTEDDEAFASLKAPIKRVTRLQTHIGAAPTLNKMALPDAEKIEVAVRAALL